MFKRTIRTLSIALAIVMLPWPMSSAWALPAGNTIQQWNQIAEDQVVGSGTFQAEGFIYMAYVSAAVYDAVVAIEGGFESYGPAIKAPQGASVDAAVIEAAYQTLWAYFPPSSCNPATPPPAYAFCLGVRPRLDEFHAEALSAIAAGQAKTDGKAVGLRAANNILGLRSGDGRMTPIGVTSSFPTLAPGPAVWRLSPPAFAAPQTPWVGEVRPFILQSADQFLPDPPPSLQSREWTEAFSQIKSYGEATSTARTPEQTAIARFWSANVVRQYNRLAREVAENKGLGLLQTARLTAMVDTVGADALISCLFAKYHYLFWRPVTAIDQAAVTADGSGPVPGFDDGNPATLEQIGWRPLLATPNHPEYPAAHGAITSAMAEVFSTFLGTQRIDIDIHGFGAAGGDAVIHFEMANDLRNEIIYARLWAGLHYHFSSVAGVVLGRNVAKHDLRQAFRPLN